MVENATAYSLGDFDLPSIDGAWVIHQLKHFEPHQAHWPGCAYGESATYRIGTVRSSYQLYIVLVDGGLFGGWPAFEKIEIATMIGLTDVSYE